MNNFKKLILGLFLIFLILVGIVINDNWNRLSVVYSSNDNIVGTQNLAFPDENLLEVHFLDVGQGDAIYIKTPDDIDVLIDGGPDKNVLSQLGRVMDFWDHQIDVVILTHPHSDHLDGLIEVLRRFDVKKVYYTGVLYAGSDYRVFLEEIQKQNIETNIVNSKFKIDLGNEVDLEFLWPQVNYANQKVKELNNTSIVNLLRYRDIEFLLTGDMETEVEELLIENNDYEDIDVLKVAHHASTSSSSLDYLEKIAPEIAVIHVGADNSFGHPHRRVVDRLDRLKIQTFRTDLLGTITFKTDGVNLFQTP